MTGCTGSSGVISWVPDRASVLVFCGWICKALSPADYGYLSTAWRRRNIGVWLGILRYAPSHECLFQDVTSGFICLLNVMLSIFLKNIQMFLMLYIRTDSLLNMYC